MPSLIGSPCGRAPPSGLADGPRMGRRLGWSTKEPWQRGNHGGFPPVFYERFRDLGRKHGDQMGSSWENSWEMMGCFGTNTMKYECV